ncbi:MAG TPA: adenine deaminase [Deltaproteobacteria bacterium]|nr:adenine deaminase [Deltaproteobacteria bacterium]HPR54932.1 adenine deaminase [Deltaproteobacteria bacterium]
MKSTEHPEAFTISGNLADVVAGRIFPATLHVRGGRIVRIEPKSRKQRRYIIPGLVDSHVHIESSMLTPAEFARVALTHGTVAAVCDPHEIANVLGMGGIRYMIENARTSPFRFSFGAPSCVPATTFETSGAAIGVPEIEALLAMDEISHLGEVMNYPGVIARDPAVMAKIDAAKRAGKPVDGHAPGLRGDALAAYVSAGIATDHETSDLEEAMEKLSLGMKVLIRQGSAARDFPALHGIIDHRGGMCMFCSDDMHPDELLRGHMDVLVRDAIRLGHDPITVLRCASLNPARHYGLSVGLLQEGDPADFLVVDDLDAFTVQETYCRGRLAARGGASLLHCVTQQAVNAFHAVPMEEAAFAVRARIGAVNVMEAGDGSLTTGRSVEEPLVRGGYAVSDPGRDILKIAVVNRYRESPPALAFIRGFGLKRGACASSVAHDSHNIVAVGVEDADICRAVNTVIGNRGGLAVASGSLTESLRLPIAGLMSDAEGPQVAAGYARLQKLTGELGSPLSAPFITLSFMALLVIPRLKLSDRGLFDAEWFVFTPLWTDADRD